MTARGYQPPGPSVDPRPLPPPGPAAGSQSTLPHSASSVLGYVQVYPTGHEGLIPVIVDGDDLDPPVLYPTREAATDEMVSLGGDTEGWRIAAVVLCGSDGRIGS